MGRRRKAELGLIKVERVVWRLREGREVITPTGRRGIVAGWREGGDRVLIRYTDVDFEDEVVLPARLPGLEPL